MQHQSGRTSVRPRISSQRAQPAYLGDNEAIPSPAANLSTVIGSAPSVSGKPVIRPSELCDQAWKPFLSTPRLLARESAKAMDYRT